MKSIKQKKISKEFIPLIRIMFVVLFLFIFLFSDYALASVDCATCEDSCSGSYLLDSCGTGSAPSCNGCGCVSTCSQSCGAACDADNDCSADGTYCRDGDSTEYRDYYCTAACACTYSSSSVTSCNGANGWYGGGNSPTTCGVDPTSYYRDYYCSSSNCNSYSNTDSANYDSYDTCSAYCYNNKIYSYRDNYVITNTNTRQDALGSETENCLTKASTDSDGGATYTTGGYVNDYTGCTDGGSSCLYTTYPDFCSGDTLTEYTASGSSYSNGTYDCNTGDTCSDQSTMTDFYCYDTTNDYCTSGSFDRDTTQARCEATAGDCDAQVWFSSLGTGGAVCCGDDGTSDDFSTYSGSTTTSASLSCRRCSDGSDLGTVVLCGNGNFSSSNTGCISADKTSVKSGYCFYGDITCTSASATNGSVTSLLLGNGNYTGSLTTATSLTCYYGDITCADNSYSNGSNRIIYGNGYTSSDKATATSLTCYYGNLGCTDGTATNGTSGSYCGNGYFSSSSTGCASANKATATSGYCFYDDITCADGSASSSSVSSLLYGNGNVIGSGTSRNCYYGDVTCADNSYSNGTNNTVYGWGWYSGTLSTSTTVECKSGAGTCTDGSYSNDTSSTLYGNGYISGSTCYYGDIDCVDGIETNGTSCTLDSNDICGDGTACFDCTTTGYLRQSTTACYTSCTTDDQCDSPTYFCNGDNICQAYVYASTYLTLSATNKLVFGENGRLTLRAYN
jgi:hypothetical protein